MVDKNKPNDAPNAGPPGSADEFATDGIATKLRELYSEIESEGVPDDLVHLLDKLDKAEKSQAEKNNRQER